MAADPGARILVIDDEVGFRDLLAFELGGRGYSVVTAADGEEGVARVRREAFDVVVCDVTMPRRDGLSAAPLIKALAPRCEVVLITGHAAEDTARLAKSMGVHAFLLKPFTMDDLCRVVEDALRRARRGRSAPQAGGAAEERPTEGYPEEVPPPKPWERPTKGYPEEVPPPKPWERP